MSLTFESFWKEQALQMCTLAGWPAETAAKLAPLLVAGPYSQNLVIFIQ
jgi:hypothetical protein